MVFHHALNKKQLHFEILAHIRLYVHNDIFYNRKKRTVEWNVLFQFFCSRVIRFETWKKWACVPCAQLFFANFWFSHNDIFNMIWHILKREFEGSAWFKLYPDLSYLDRALPVRSNFHEKKMSPGSFFVVSLLLSGGCTIRSENEKLLELVNIQSKLLEEYDVKLKSVESELRKTTEIQNKTLAEYDLKLKSVEKIIDNQNKEIAKLRLDVKSYCEKELEILLSSSPGFKNRSHEIEKRLLGKYFNVRESVSLFNTLAKCLISIKSATLLENILTFDFWLIYIWLSTFEFWLCYPI